MKDKENAAIHYDLLALILFIFAMVFLNNIFPMQIWAEYIFIIIAVVGFLIAVYSRLTLR